MSEQNVEIVRRNIDAFNHRDPQAAEAVVAPDVVFEVAFESLDLDGVYRGREEVRRWWRTWLADLDEVRFEYELIDAGQVVLAAGHVISRGRRSGAEITRECYWVYTLRDELIVRAQGFWETQRALGTAGLSEEAMAEENVEIVRRVAQALNRRDVEGIVGECHPDVMWHPAMQALVSGEATTYRGPQGSARC